MCEPGRYVKCMDWRNCMTTQSRSILKSVVALLRKGTLFLLFFFCLNFRFLGLLKKACILVLKVFIMKSKDTGYDMAISKEM